MNAAARNYYRDSKDPRRNYPTAAKEAHLRLLASLSNVIDPSVNRAEYEAIIKRLVPYMASIINRRSRNFIDIFESLEKIHFIEIGKYGALKKVLREFGPRYVQIIETCEDELRMIMNRENPIPFQERTTHHPEQSFMSTLSEDESHRWLGKIPYKTKIKILTEEDLENFSKAINPAKFDVIRRAFWLNEKELDKIIYNSRGSRNEACYLILLKWQEKNGGVATVKDLTERFSDAVAIDEFSISFIKARSAIQTINMEVKYKNQSQQ